MCIRLNFPKIGLSLRYKLSQFIRRPDRKPVKVYMYFISSVKHFHKFLWRFSQLMQLIETCVKNIALFIAMLGIVLYQYAQSNYFCDTISIKISTNKNISCQTNWCIPMHTLHTYYTYKLLSFKCDKKSPYRIWGFFHIYSTL